MTISGGVVSSSGATAGVAFAPPVTDGVSPVYLDSFAPGGTDDQKLTAAMTYAAARTHIPAIMFPARTVTLNTGGRIPYNGLRLLGPEGSLGPKSLELGPNLSPCAVNVGVGNEANALFNGAGVTVYDMSVRGLAFQATNNTTQFFHNAGTGNLYAAEFDSLTFYGFQHVFGGLSKCGVTQVIFSGDWQVIGGVGTQFYLGGSDCCLWMGGYCNMGMGPGGTGAPGIIFETLAKSSIGYLYLTLYNNWGGLLLSGANTAYGACSFHGGTYEGLPGTPSPHPVINVTGGDWSFHGGAFNYVTNGSSGVITQSGGRVVFDEPSYVAAPTPAPAWLYQTGGSAVIAHPQGGGSPSARWANGSTVPLPFNAISNYP